MYFNDPEAFKTSGNQQDPQSAAGPQAGPQDDIQKAIQASLAEQTNISSEDKQLNEAIMASITN